MDCCQVRGVLPVQTKISSRHGHLSETNQAKIREKVERLPRFFDRISAIDVVVDLQNALAVRVDIQVTAEHTPEFVAHDTAEELIRAVDGAMSKMEQQLRKHKEKVHGHKGQGSDKGNGIIAEPESEEEAVEQE
jgi:putative sigma-54 modulation protein